MLTIQNLTKDFGKYRALDAVSFTMGKGSAALLIGPNGAGKTTIIKCILGLLKFKGKILVDGIDISKDGVGSRTRIGYVPQQLTLGYNISIENQSQYIGKLKGTSKEEVVAALKQCNLWEIRKRKINALSHGMRQKLGIALALLTDPPLLIFDEPINNVDLRGQLDFRTTVQDLSKKGKTILVATHLSGLSEFVATALVLHKGKLVAQGTPKELLTKMSAADTIYLRVDESSAQGVLDILDTQFKHHHDQLSPGHKVTRNEEWLVFSLPPGMKAKVVQEIMNAGYNVKDLIVEPSTIESQYVKLLGEAAIP